MRILTLIAFIWPIFLCAQKPFELERYSEAYYTEQLVKIPTPYTPNTAVDAWWLAYKSQRASNPGKYFPAGNAVRDEAKAIIQASSQSDVLNAIEFIESKGTLPSVEKLVNSNSTSSYVLPARYLAAFIIGNVQVERTILKEMDVQGMLSPVLKVFGANAMKSAKPVDACITSGLQDLIAVRFAQLIDGINPNAKVYNIFVTQCAAYQGKSIGSVLSGNESIWVSPVCSEDFLRSNMDRLHMTGLGYSLLAGEDLENSDGRFAETVNQMDWTGKTNTTLTPADKGLLNALKPLAQVMEKKGFQKESTTLKSFIKYYANR
jgi:hypothetical protein